MRYADYGCTVTNFVRCVWQQMLYTELPKSVDYYWNACRLSNYIWPEKGVGMYIIEENGTPSVTGHILSAGVSR